MKTLNEVRQTAKQACAEGRLLYSIELYEKIFDNGADKLLIEDVINYGAILRKTGQLNKANVHYIRHLPQFADSIHLIQNACNCWIELGEFEQSRTVLKKALKKRENNPKLMLMLGFTELSAEETNKACNIFEKILQIDSGNFDAWFNLAVSKAKLGHLEEALSCFRQADQRRNNHQLLKANVISILKDLNRIDDAWNEITDMSPNIRSSEDIRAIEASLLMAEEKYAESTNILKDLARENPHNPKHWLNWSTCLKAIKYTIAPKKILQQAILWHPGDIDLQHSYAQSIAEMGQLESYKKTKECWRRDLNELSTEHIFSRLFLEITSDIKDHKERRKSKEEHIRNIR